jgi:hypothetical protein
MRDQEISSALGKSFKDFSPPRGFFLFDQVIFSTSSGYPHIYYRCNIKAFGKEI